MTATLSERIGEKIGIEASEQKFSLREHVRTFLAESNEADPVKVAALIAEDLTDAERVLALKATLPEYVRQTATSLAAVSRKPARQSMTTPQRVKAWYSQILASRLFTGEEWKFLADCTADDLQGAAAERYKAAALTHAEGDRLVKLANLLEETGRETVRDVSEAELRAALGES